MTDDAGLAALVADALGTAVRSVARQPLAHSGNTVARVALADGRVVVARVSAHPRAYAHTARHLHAFRALGLPVHTLLAEGATAHGGAFVVLDWLPGRDLLYELATMTQPQAVALAQALTRCQQRVGTLAPGQGYGWAALGERAGAACWSDVFGAVAAHDAPDETQTTRRLRALRARSEAYFAGVRPVCFLDDLTVKNVLVEDGELRGLIDLDEVCYGDPMLFLGKSLAHLACDVGDAGAAYGQALLECWDPAPAPLRAMRFYGALWASGFVRLAQARGDLQRAANLAPIAEALLARAET